MADIQQDHRNRQQDTAQQFEPASPDRENAQQIATELVEIVHDEEDAGPDHTGDQRVERRIGDMLRVLREPPAQQADHRDRGEKTDHHHQAVALDGHMDNGNLN